MILELSGKILEAFGDDFRDIVLSLLRVLWKPASSSVFVVLGTFWLTSFAKFAIDNSNDIATFSLTRELANISRT